MYGSSEPVSVWSTIPPRIAACAAIAPQQRQRKVALLWIAWKFMFGYARQFVDPLSILVGHTNLAWISSPSMVISAGSYAGWFNFASHIMPPWCLKLGRHRIDHNIARGI